MEGLIQHHVKYEEIHGEDKIVMMTPSEHIKLHKRLRKENKCEIPTEELERISRLAHRRTDSCKKLKVKYNKNMQRINFRENMMPNVTLREQLIYNIKTGTPTWTSYFEGNRGTKLFYVEVD